MEKNKDKKPILAICYDFDKTLSPDDMQAQGYIQSIDYEVPEFWKESNQLAADNDMDQNLAYMYMMSQKSQGKVLFTRKTLEADGAKVQLFPGVDRKVRVGIKKAIEIVDQVDDDALCALTVAYTVKRLFPATGSIIQGLNVLENVFSKLCYTNLCKGREWLDHLEILDAVRLTQFSSLKKLDLFYAEQLDGYVCVGIKKESENYQKALSLLNSGNLPRELLCDHELLEGYVRLPVINKKQICSLKLVNRQMISGELVDQFIETSNEQNSIIEQIYDLYDKNEEQKKIVTDNFALEWKKRETLNLLLKWWNEIPMAFDITAVGTVLAHANAQRCDSSIPPLE